MPGGLCRSTARGGSNSCAGMHSPPLFSRRFTADLQLSYPCALGFQCHPAGPGLNYRSDTSSSATHERGCAMNSNSVRTTFATTAVMLMGTEDVTPGDEFPTHKHLGQDEILYIEKGTVHVHLGDQERDLHAGGTVFIPAYTWVSVKNAGTDTVSVVFVFSAPGFENYMCCDSVLPNETSLAGRTESVQSRRARHLQRPGTEPQKVNGEPTFLPRPLSLLDVISSEARNLLCLIRLRT